MTQNNQVTLKYLALGDSYTIGEAVPQTESFPYQLVAELNAASLKFGTPQIIAKTGWTTDELQAAISTADNLVPPYDIVTLLIGVNNQYRGLSSARYRKEFKSLLKQAIQFAGNKKDRVFVISIPDWGITNFGKKSGRDLTSVARQIDEFNNINKDEATALGVSYTDITPHSRLAATDEALIAEDGLHPSGKMYTIWARKLAEVIIPALK